MSKVRRIGVFGHYGTLNLGDEAIVRAVLQSIRERCPGSELVCFSIDPVDTTRRHEVQALPVRHLKEAARNAAARGPHGDARPSPPPGWKERLKKVPILSPLARSCLRFWGYVGAASSELRFSWRSLHRLRTLDLLVVAGSGQLQDSFGGPMNFSGSSFLSMTVKRPPTHVSSLVSQDKHAEGRTQNRPVFEGHFFCASIAPRAA